MTLIFGKGIRILVEQSVVNYKTMVYTDIVHQMDTDIQLMFCPAFVLISRHNAFDI